MKCQRPEQTIHRATLEHFDDQASPSCCWSGPETKRECGQRSLVVPIAHVLMRKARAIVEIAASIDGGIPQVDTWELLQGHAI